MENKRKYIMNNLKEKWDYLKNNDYKVVALFLQGSQNYNLDVYDDDYKSDIDAKAIVLPSLKDIVLNKTPISTTIVLENNEHIDVKDIRVMKDMFIKQNISYIELLFTKYYIIDENYKDYFEKLFSMRNEIASINRNQFIKCFKGMSMEKLKAMEHPYPTIIDKINKYGYDPKQLHHIVRLNEFAERYLLKKTPLEDCYISNKKLELIKIKKGFYNLQEARNMASYYDTLTKNICNQFITPEDVINTTTINEMNELLTNILEHSLKEELGFEDV